MVFFLGGGNGVLAFSLSPFSLFLYFIPLSFIPFLTSFIFPIVVSLLLSHPVFKSHHVMMIKSHHVMMTFLVFDLDVLFIPCY